MLKEKPGGSPLSGFSFTFMDMIIGYMIIETQEGGADRIINTQEDGSNRIIDTQDDGANRIISTQDIGAD